MSRMAHRHPADGLMPIRELTPDDGGRVPVDVWHRRPQSWEPENTVRCTVPPGAVQASFADGPPPRPSAGACTGACVSDLVV